MVKLKLSIPHENGVRTEIYTLDISRSNAGATLGDKPLELTAEKLIHYGDSRVFKGSLKYQDDVYPSDVACKIVEADDVPRLEEEAVLYTTILKDAEDDYVPIFLFYASGTSPYTNQTIACLVTVYGGKPLRGSWGDVPVKLRYACIKCMGLIPDLPSCRYWIFVAFLKIHRLGLWHGDFKPRNVVVDNRNYPRLCSYMPCRRSPVQAL